MANMPLTTTMLSIFMLVSMLHTSKAQLLIDYIRWDCRNTSTYLRNSVYDTNLKILLPTLASNISSTKYGFLNFTVGHGSVQPAYGLALCRGDIAQDECQDCVQMARDVALDKCSMTTEATVWKEKCMLRYSNKSIFSHLQEYPQLVLYNVDNVTDADRWVRFLGDVVSQITLKAASDQSGIKFATKEAWYSPMAKFLYSLAQCTPDLTVADCKKCLDIADGYLPVRQQGGIVLTPSCTLRYEVYPFYQNFSREAPSPTLAPPAVTGTTSAGKSKKSQGSLVLKVTLGILVLIVFVLVAAFTFFKCRKRRLHNDAGIMPSRATRAPNFEHGDDEKFMMEVSLQYDLATLQVATSNFSDDSKLGEGGFGGVYKGILPDGQEVAVKRLSKGSHQGLEQFKNEVVFVARLQQRNLVKLLGYCVAPDEMLLVYELVPNKSLDIMLFDPNIKERLDWPTRYRIINGIARGLSYLHEDSRLRIVHRDLKASNVLLDADMNPKISDFGLAKDFTVTQEQKHTNRIAGTFGYMAPEYIEYGEFSTKSDVYSFGVLVLEIVCGKKISNRKIWLAKNLLTYAWKHWNEDTLSEFVDASVGTTYSYDEVKRCVQISLLCVQGDTEQRPSMIKIVSYLNSNVDLPTPPQPAFFMSSKTELSSGAMELLSDKSTRSESSSRTTELKSDKSTSRSSLSFSGFEAPPI